MNQANVQARQERGSEGGFMMLLAIMATLVPMFLIIAATTQTMVSRQSRLRASADNERSFAAAESGIDYCLFRASTSLGLSDTTYTGNLGDGTSYSAVVTYLKTDGLDNDNDDPPLMDALDPKENIYRVVSSGRFRDTTRRIVAYLGQLPYAPPIYGALHVAGGNSIQVQGSAEISGMDVNIDGSPGPGPNLPGMAVESPTTALAGIGMIQLASRPKVVGSTLPPSVEQGPPFNWDVNRTQIQNAASLVLTNDQYNNLQFGNAAANDFRVTYRGGNVTFQGSSHGAGIMYVDGDFLAQGNFLFEGIVYVRGNVEVEVSAAIVGALICDTNNQILLKGTSRVQYSSEAISLAATLLPGKFIAFNGWQEIARN